MPLLARKPVSVHEARGFEGAAGYHTCEYNTLDSSSYAWVQVDMAPVLETSKRHDLLLWEDCAQVFTGRQGYLGHPGSDAVFFSFGVIKRATAFGGGVARVRDDAVLSGNTAAAEHASFFCQVPIAHSVALGKRVSFTSTVQKSLCARFSPRRGKIPSCTIHGWSLFFQPEGSVSVGCTVLKADRANRYYSILTQQLTV